MLLKRARRRSDAPAPGIRRHGAGWQAAVTVRGERSFAQWPLEISLREMQEWQKDERARLRTLTAGRPKGGTFDADAHRYLQLPDVQALPTYAERVQHIEAWIAVFATRRRRTIGPLDIEAQKYRWLQSRGDDPETGKPLPGYAPNSVNKRLRALSNLWTKLDGRRAPNPVLEVRECEEPDAEARGLPYDVIEAILAAIPETYIGVTKDGTRTRGKSIRRPSQTKARLRVIAYTGLSHGQLMKLTPADVDLDAATVRLVARTKGKSARRAHHKPLPALLPLIQPAVDAFREFDRLGCWGPFSPSSMWKAFQRACGELDLEGLTPYDFRHSFLTAVYLETKDLRVTGQFGGHRSERTTKRYTGAAVAPHVAEAAEKVARRLQGKNASDERQPE